MHVVSSRQDQPKTEPVEEFRGGAGLDLDLLRTIVAIADTGSFNRAARAVFRTPSAVSMQMKKLEDQVGRPLFAKDGRSVILTPDGEALVGYGRRILKLAEEALAALSRAAGRGRRAARRAGRLRDALRARDPRALRGELSERGSRCDLRFERRASRPAREGRARRLPGQCRPRRRAGPSRPRGASRAPRLGGPAPRLRARAPPSTACSVARRLLLAKKRARGAGPRGSSLSRRLYEPPLFRSARAGSRGSGRGAAAPLRR